MTPIAAVPVERRRRASRLLAIVALALVVAGGLALAAPPASAQPASGARIVRVFTSSGLVDPVLEQALTQAIAASDPSTSVALVLQMDSGGAVISDADLEGLLRRVRNSPVPVDIWIGPSGSELTGKAALLAGEATAVGMAPGTRLGLDGVPVSPALTAGARRPIPTGTVGPQEAQDLGITAAPAPTLGDFVVNLAGVESKETTQGNQRRREPVTAVVFSQLTLPEQLMHTAASPPVAYLLLTIGLALLVFELFTAGVGVAGAIGAGSLVLACYGLAVLPVRPWALAAIVLAMVAFAIDVQTGVPRFWTGVGVALFVVGSFALVDGYPLSWVTLVAGIGGVLLAFLAGMPSMVRTRFSTPTIGREWMIGEMGRATSPIAPDGVVQVRGALWRATTNRATPIDELDPVRVTGIEGLVLEVEPEEGGARDYRERH